MKTQRFSPLTVTQALVVRALLPPYRSLAILPPQRGVIRLSTEVLPVKYQTFKRLYELGVLARYAEETRVDQREVYRLSEQGRAVWAEHCRIEGTPKHDPSIDG